MYPAWSGCAADEKRKLRKAGAAEPALEEFRWQIEELRVSLFAQELRTLFPVSLKRLNKIWDSIERWSKVVRTSKAKPE